MIGPGTPAGVAASRQNDTSSVPSPSQVPKILARLVDAESFTPFKLEAPPVFKAGLAATLKYAETLEAARDRTGSIDSIVSGEAKIGGLPCVVVVSEFRFLGGSMGVVAGELIVEAIEHASINGLPVVVITASGGARMQEGSIALAQMLKVSASIESFRQAAGLVVVYNENPTLGGVLASYGSLGHLNYASPGASIGLTGAKVVESLQGEPARNVQSAESLRSAGLLDGVMPLEDFREVMIGLFTLWNGRSQVQTSRYGAPVWDGESSWVGSRSSAPDAWAAVRRSRLPERPGAKEVIQASFSNITYLHGDELGGGDDPYSIAALASLDDLPVVLFAQDRSAPEGDRPSPRSFRKAQRALRIAGELRLPFINIVDSAGVSTAEESERSGLAKSIAHTMTAAYSLKSPILSVLLGQGGGGAAIAFLMADHVICAENAWLAPISPEAASVILHGTPARAEYMARTQGITAFDLKLLGIVDEVVLEDETGGNLNVAFSLIEGVRRALSQSFKRLCAEDVGTRLDRRRLRFRALGVS